MACSKEKESQIREDMKEYYGKTIQNRDELLINNQELEAGGCREESKIKDQEASGCREESKNNDQEAGGCPLAKCKLPRHVTEALAMVHPDVQAKSYGCGLPVPELLEGCHVLDLGSGAGHDCFTLAKLVGETGHVTGVDMTEEQLDFARRYTDYHRETFGYSKPNTEFVRGYIENLGEAGLRDNTFDVIISNCTVNLSPDKKAVLGEAYRVLKSQIREDMKEYYGKTIQNRDELLINNQELEAGGCREESKIKDQEASGCREESKNNDQEAGGCPLAKCKLPRHVTEALAMVHPDVKAKSYGCGLPVPELLEGCHVLDLGSGAGHDCFTLAKLVGETGHVTGVDMTEEQLDFARRYNDYHREALGYSKPNTEFVRGYIENLGEAGLRDNTFDVIISNCTVNLSPDKKAVFGEAYRVLK
ncbi:PREDICTED: uncharacterized protein LOC109485678, partial [Branchiostoma belcheri]|uniref:Arsenite methyltransferase n=1 Tax=Branchiostoma belcheri TaxID=7741 RepID=A0A6P5A5V2_BRABE